MKKNKDLEVLDSKDLSWWERRRYKKHIEELNRLTEVSHNRGFFLDVHSNIYMPLTPTMTATKAIYLALLNGEVLTTKIAWKRWATSELRSIRCKLEKRYGIIISSERVEGKNYFKYWIKPENMPKK